MLYVINVTNHISFGKMTNNAYTYVTTVKTVEPLLSGHAGTAIFWLDNIRPVK